MGIRRPNEDHRNPDDPAGDDGVGGGSMSEDRSLKVTVSMADLRELRDELFTLRKVVGLLEKQYIYEGNPWVLWEDVAKKNGLDIDAMLKRLK